MAEAANSDSLTHTASLRWWKVLCLFIVLGGLFANLGGYRTFTSHESFAVVPAREMLRSGEFIVPRFGQEPRLAKPPLMYWILAGTASVTGSFSEWAMRLPSALAAFALAVLVGFWAKFWYGTKAGWAAFLMQGTCWYILTYGRKAEVDVLLCLLTTSALFLFIHRNETPNERHRFARWSGIYFLLALSWMAKFHYGPSLVIAPILGFLLWEKRPRELRSLLNPAGLVLMGLAMVVWSHLVLQRVPEAADVWASETVGRAMGQLQTRPVWYYLPQLLGQLFPWTLFVVIAIPLSWKRSRNPNGHGERFLWAWLLVDLAILHLSESKHPNYLFVILPAFTLMTAPVVSRFAEKLHAWLEQCEPRRLLIGSVATVMVMLGLAACCVAEWQTLRSAVWWLAGFGSAGVICSVIAFTRHRTTSGLMVAGGMVFVLILTVQYGLFPAIDHRSSTADFAETVREQLAGDEEVVSYFLGQSPLVYYLNDPVLRVDVEAKVATLLEERRSLLIVCYDWAAPSLDAWGDRETLSKLEADVGEFSPRHSDLLCIRLHAKQPCLSAEKTAGEKRSSGDAHAARLRVNAQ